MLLVFLLLGQLSSYLLMIMTYLLFFFASILGTNGIPHFVKGLAGEKHMTPFNKPSGAATNVIWGAFNIFLSVLIFHWAITYSYNFYIASFVVLAAATFGGALQGNYWQNDAKARGR